MRRAAIVVLASVGFVVGACGGGGGAATASASPPGGRPIVIKERTVIAATSGADIIATGEVLEGSTNGGSPFCVGGTTLDTHGSTDPALRLIVETITCPNGTVSLAFTPDDAQGATQAGSWFIVGGSGAFEGLRGNGGMEAVYGPNQDSPTTVTFTGTVTP